MSPNQIKSAVCFIFQHHAIIVIRAWKEYNKKEILVYTLSLEEFYIWVDL